MEQTFEELSHDSDLVSRLEQFSEAITKIHNAIELACDPELYNKLSNADKIKYNSLMSFSINSMFWMYLRAEGISKNNQRCIL